MEKNGKKEKALMAVKRKPLKMVGSNTALKIFKR